MDPYSNLSDKAKKKLQLYTAAYYLFENGKSYPQIVEILDEFESDKFFLEEIVENARREDWDKLYMEAKELIGKGVAYDKVIAEISRKESDMEIVEWICDSWYQWKVYYAEYVTDSTNNILEGSKWVVISIIVLPLLFLINTSIVSKIVWCLACVVAIIQWIVGIRQRRISNQIEKIFKNDTSD